jgi:hypothetical protein
MGALDVFHKVDLRTNAVTRPRKFGAADKPLILLKLGA